VQKVLDKLLLDLELFSIATRTGDHLLPAGASAIIIDFVQRDVHSMRVESGLVTVQNSLAAARVACRRAPAASVRPQRIMPTLQQALWPEPAQVRQAYIYINIFVIPKSIYMVFSKTEIF